MIPAPKPDDDDLPGAGPSAASAPVVHPSDVKRSRHFVEATRTIFATRNMEELPQAIVEAAIRVMNADAVSLLLPRPDGSLALAFASEVPPEIVSRTRIKVGEGIAGRVARSLQPVVLQGQAPDGHGRALSSIVYPLVSAGRLLGIVTFNRRTPEPSFGDEELELAAVLASQIMLALENARLSRQTTLSEKLAAVGQLAAGIAHEINTPVQFVGDSIHFVRGAMEDLRRLLEPYHRLRDSVAGGQVPPPELLAEIAEIEEDIELDFLTAEVPRALERSIEGVRRVGEIVQAIKTFGRAESREKVLADVNRLLATSTVVARPEHHHIADSEDGAGRDSPAALPPE